MLLELNLNLIVRNCLVLNEKLTNSGSEHLFVLVAIYWNCWVLLVVIVVIVNMQQHVIRETSSCWWRLMARSERFDLLGGYHHVIKGEGLRWLQIHGRILREHSLIQQCRMVYNWRRGMSNRCLKMLMSSTMLAHRLSMNYMVWMRTSKVSVVHMWNRAMYMRMRIMNLIAR